MSAALPLLAGLVIALSAAHAAADPGALPDTLRQAFDGVTIGPSATPAPARFREFPVGEPVPQGLRLAYDFGGPVTPYLRAQPSTDRRATPGRPVGLGGGGQDSGIDWSVFQGLEVSLADDVQVDVDDGSLALKSEYRRGRVDVEQSLRIGPEFFGLAFDASF